MAEAPHEGAFSELGSGVADLGKAAYHYGEATVDSFGAAYHYGAEQVDSLMGDTDGAAQQETQYNQSSQQVDAEFHQAGRDLLGDPVQKVEPPIVVPMPEDTSSGDDGGASDGGDPQPAVGGDPSGAADE